MVPPLALAYLPSLDELFEWIALRKGGLRSAYMETHSEVFTPNYATPALFQSTPTSAKNFIQRIYWRAGRQLVIETLSVQDKRVLHVYLQQKNSIQAASLSQRVFSVQEVRPPFLGFMQGSARAWQTELNEWGVFPTVVRLVPHLKSTHVLKLWQNEEKSLWLDEASLYPIRLETQIQGNGKEPWRLAIQFGPFVMANSDSLNVHYPFQMDFLIEQRLFRRTRVLNFVPAARQNKALIKRVRDQLKRVDALRVQRLHTEYLP